MLRIAFAGASGTGKSTLAAFVSEHYGLPMNPVGARSVSRAMGFDSPYDVDKVGRRSEFQRRLVEEKVDWESARDSFVTDRTTLDNLAYTMLHDVHSIDAPLLDRTIEGLRRYTHVFFCPVSSFCDVADDPSRVRDAIYHQLYDATIRGLFLFADRRTIWLRNESLADRKGFIRAWITSEEG